MLSVRNFLLAAFIYFNGTDGIIPATAYPVCASIPSFVGTEAFGPQVFAQISATLMIAVYVGQAIASPLMAAFLASSGGMGFAWNVFAVTTMIGMMLLLALRVSPLRKGTPLQIPKKVSLKPLVNRVAFLNQCLSPLIVKKDKQESYLLVFIHNVN